MPLPVLLSDPRMVVFNTSPALEFIDHRAIVRMSILNPNPTIIQLEDVVSVFIVGDTYLIVSLAKCYDEDHTPIEIGEGSPVIEHYFPVHNVLRFSLDYKRSEAMVTSGAVDAALASIPEGDEETAM